LGVTLTRAALWVTDPKECPVRWGRRAFQGRRQPARKGLNQGGGGSRVKGREAIGEADAEGALDT
jgi:hypothetical protein